jgi:diacylglycerol kinase (ATP)
MVPQCDIRVIVNPSSSAGKTSRRLHAISSLLERAFPGRCAFFLTRGPGDGIRLASEAADASPSMIVAVGGDGTIHEVVNGMMHAGGALPPLGIVSSGSGEGFALSASLPRSLEDQVELLRLGVPRKVDLGLITVRGANGALRSRYVVNEAQFGIGAAVVAATCRWRKRVGGLLGYGLATLAEVFRSPDRMVQLTIDGHEGTPQSILGLSVGNGERTGGGMTLTPCARIDDGRLDLLVIHGQSVPERLRSFPRIYTGAHARARGFSLRTFTVMEAESDENVPVAADGEMIGMLPASIRIIPGVFTMILPTAEGA